MKAGGDKRARNTGALENRKVGAVAHATGRVDVAAGCDLAYGAQPIEVRTGAAAYSRKGHDNQPLRPGRHVVEERRRPHKRLIAKVERQNDAIMF